MLREFVFFYFTEISRYIHYNIIIILYSIRLSNRLKTKRRITIEMGLGNGSMETWHNTI